MPPTPPHLEVLFTPSEFESLNPAKLQRSTCVVFDVLRATTSIITALTHGAQAVRPVRSIEEAVNLRRLDHRLLLGGERHGWRITAQHSGGIEFDFGNSPAEYATPRIQGRRLAMTTTNGTRALQVASSARQALVASLLNLSATARALQEAHPSSLILIGAGTYDEAALEDTLAAGALCEALRTLYPDEARADSARIAQTLWRLWRHDILEGLSTSRNGRRLLKTPKLQADVQYAARQDTCSVVAELQADGWIRTITPPQ